MEILWKTSSPLQVRDPVMNVPTSVSADGAYKIQIDDGAKFLTKLLGNNVQSVSQNDITNYFKNEFQQHIKASIAKSIMGANKEILGICSEQDLLASDIQIILGDIFDDYGVRVVNFSIASIDIPQNDPNRKTLDEAFVKRGEMDILGDYWKLRETSTILNNVAKNPGAGGLAGTGAGLGMGVAVGSTFAEMARQFMGPIQTMQPQPVQEPPHNQSTGRYTQKTAANAEVNSAKPPVASLADEIAKLKDHFDRGILTQAEFEAGKKKLLDL
jgi:membrane protease subunit (stomatin/prohibitin family)